MLNHKIGIEKIIEKRISQGNSYLNILKSIYGADPREVWEIYKKYKIETSKKIGLTNLYPQYPEPHPAYSQWRITKDSTKIILSKIFEKNYKNICFLGCPILGIEFSKLKQGKVKILDIDKDVLDYASKFADTTIYNVGKNVPEKIKNKFECVVCDPPWYYDDISLFIKRATDLVKIGGTIYLSLPGILTKPSIPEERLEFQKLLSSLKLIITELQPIVEYEVPPFEYMAYKDIPVFSGEVWRKGDWVKIKKCGNVKTKVPRAKFFQGWTEYSFGKKRIFIKNNKENDEYRKPKLIFLCQDNILNSVSKRNPLIAKIDIWTSRNVIFHIETGWGVIKTITENIEKNEKKIIQVVSKKYHLDVEKVRSECTGTIKILKNN